MSIATINSAIVPVVVAVRIERLCGCLCSWRSKSENEYEIVAYGYEGLRPFDEVVNGCLA